jgi:plastocyanin
MVAALVLLSLIHRELSVSGRVTLPSGKPAFQAIVSFTGSVRPKPLAKAVVDQRDRTFIPHVSVVTVGTRVDFPNNDVIFHNVFTEFNSTKFDLGNYAKGTKKTQLFDKPGLAVIMCSIHPDMGAYIMVVDTPFYAITNKNGEYRIPAIPNGNYKVEVWHESGAKASFEKSTTENQHIDITLRR